MTTSGGERRIVLLPKGSGRSHAMARKQQTILVCDGCSTELEESKGSARVTVDVFEGPLRKLDFCPDCAGKLPEGTERKRPGPKTK
jgi:hypothetical protein